LEIKIVTDESENYEYATEEDLPVKQKFPTTRKAGYVEDEVDVWVEATVKSYTDFLNRYNGAVYALSMEKETNAQLREENEGLAKEASRLKEELDAKPAAQEPVYSAPVEEEVAVEEEPTPAVVEQYVPQPVVVDATYASARAREIMDEAAKEAADHVSRAFERVARIETEAEAEATAIVAKAEGHVAAVLAEAEEQGRVIRENAEREAREAEDRRDEATQTAHAIVSRLDLFYTSQLEELRQTQTSVGYNPAALEVTQAPVANEIASEQRYALEEGNSGHQETVVDEGIVEEAGVEYRNEDTYSYANTTDEETPSQNEVAEEYNYEEPVEVHEQTTVVAPTEGGYEENNENHEEKGNEEETKNSSVFKALFNKDENN
jgi:hypothetical protein